MNEITESTHGLSVEAFVATVLYALLGIFIMLVTVMLVNKMFHLNAHRELVRENNVAFGILFGCMSIAISIIIASTIVG